MAYTCKVNHPIVSEGIFAKEQIDRWLVYLKQIGQSVGDSKMKSDLQSEEIKELQEHYRELYRKYVSEDVV